MTRKPMSARLAGWIFLGLFGLGGWMLFHSGARPLTGREVAGCAGYLISLAGFGVAWAGGTVKARLRAGQGARPANEPLDLVDWRRVAAMAGPHLHLGETRGVPVVGAKNCDACKRPVGILTCLAHSMTLCWPDLMAHDINGMCFYAPVDGITRESREAARERQARATG